MSTETTRNAQKGSPIQGVTLYSFTRAFHGREYTLHDLIRKVAEDGYGPGLEMIGFSSIRGFPHRVTDRFVDDFRAVVEETELVPTSLAINADAGIRRDRLLTGEELVEYMRPQIEIAARLGFPLARVQISLTPDDMEALLPLAEEHGVTLALEVHADQHGEHERILALRDRFERLGSPLLGFTEDWGATVSAFAPSSIESYRRRGAPEPLLSAVVDLWEQYRREGPPATQEVHGRRFGAFIELAAEHGRPELGVDFAINGTGLFGPAPISTWEGIMPWVRHVHAKFFGIDDAGEEPSVPVRGLIAQLVEHGYDGAVSTEYEGWHWNNWEDSFDIVAAEQALQRRAAVEAGSSMITDAAVARDQFADHLATPAPVPGAREEKR